MQLKECAADQTLTHVRVLPAQLFVLNLERLIDMGFGLLKFSGFDQYAGETDADHGAHGVLRPQGLEIDLESSLECAPRLSELLNLAE